MPVVVAHPLIRSPRLVKQPRELVMVNWPALMRLALPPMTTTDRAEHMAGLPGRELAAAVQTVSHHDGPILSERARLLKAEPAGGLPVVGFVTATLPFAPLAARA